MVRRGHGHAVNEVTSAGPCRNRSRTALPLAHRPPPRRTCALALMYPDAPSARRPGRCWTIRVVGHRDRSASVTCSSACVMPPRSRDIAALRRFAEAHAAAHARAAAVHHDASCWCRRQRCALHEDTRVACAGTVVLVLRHDPAVGQVWTLSEVCAACAASLPHARVLSRAAPPRPRVPATGAGTDPGAGTGTGKGTGTGTGTGGGPGSGRSAGTGASSNPGSDSTPGSNPGSNTGPGSAAGPGSAGGSGAGRPSPSGPATPTVGPPRLVPGGFSAPSSGVGAGPERSGGHRRGVGGRRGRTTGS